MLKGAVDPAGVSRYRFQISTDGQRWRDVGEPRYVSGSQNVEVSAAAVGLRPGALHSARLVVARREATSRENRRTSNVAFFATPAPESITTRRPAAAFAPLVHHHSEERSFPIGADRFLERSTVKWKDGDCVVTSVATGRLAKRKTPDAPLVDTARLGGDRPYRRRALDRSCRRRGRVYSATQLTRPYDRGERAAGLPTESGFYLDLLSDSRDGDPRFERQRGQRLLAPTPAYYERARVRVEGSRGLRLTYWFLYGHSQALRADDDPPAYHEGDWERVDVLVRRGRGGDRWLPRVMRLLADDRVRVVPWRDLMRVGAHPVLFSALRSHRPYVLPGRHRPRVRVGGRTVLLRETAVACRECAQWRTWERLVPVRTQPWHGFGGGWGLSFMAHDTSGPLGPR